MPCTRLQFCEVWLLGGNITHGTGLDAFWQHLGQSVDHCEVELEASLTHWPMGSISQNWHPALFQLCNLNPSNSSQMSLLASGLCPMYEVDWPAEYVFVTEPNWHDIGSPEEWHPASVYPPISPTRGAIQVTWCHNYHRCTEGNRKLNTVQHSPVST